MMPPENEAVARLFDQSTQALQAGQFERAESLLRDLLQLEASLAEAHANLAWLLERRDALDDALQHYELALALQDDNPRIHVNLGALLVRLKLPDLAERAYRHALRLAPDMPGAWCNLGALQALAWREDEAEQSLRTALALDAAHVDAHVNLAFLLLRQGHLTQGWQHLAYRNWHQSIAALLRCARWHGEPLIGRRILFVFEGGYGDVIQFCRYVPLLRQRGAARVDVLCHPPLKGLLTTLEGIGEVFGYDQDCSGEAWDYWVPGLSLPLFFETQLDSIPAVIPYLHPASDKLTRWRADIARQCPGTALRVGLVWQGSANFENDAERSLPGLDTLAELWQVAGVQFFSLQKGRGEAEVARWQGSLPLIDLAAGLGDFAETAAAIAQLDLVISVDTAVAHLAGALGKPCWLLLPAYMTDWRWLQDRTDSPWYPQVLRLFRQPRCAGWAPVVAQLRAALFEWALLHGSGFPQ